MARPFNILRGYMRMHDITQADLAAELDIGTASVSNRMTCREQWKLDEMYKVLNVIGLPESKLHEVFPPNGQNEKGCTRKVLRKVRVYEQSRT